MNPSKIPALLLIGLLSILPLWAYDFEVDGVYYNRIDTGKVEVTSKTSDRNSYSGNIILPERVTYQNKEYYVTRIGDHAFMSSHPLLFQMV